MTSRPMEMRVLLVSCALSAATLGPAACSGDSDHGGGAGAGGPATGIGAGGGGGGDPENAGAVCDAPSDCYPGVDPATLKGEALCLDRVRDGYCTHTCDTDEDCCAASGECKSKLEQVCSPFESKDGKMCFLSCEDEDLVAPPGQDGPVDPEEYCQREAGRDFICRSSGGGKDNRKVCVPGDCGVGASCAVSGDCAGDLECIAVLTGGYCGLEGCKANADCPNGSLCVEEAPGVSYCYRTCGSKSDCTFCRGWDDGATCSTDVKLVESGTSGSVCVP